MQRRHTDSGTFKIGSAIDFKPVVACVLTGIVAVGLYPPSPAHAHETKYVTDLKIMSAETWLHNAVSKGITKGAQTTASKVLSSVGKTILGGFLDSYVPGLSSILGLGGGTQSAKPVLDAIRASSVQLADRMRGISDLIAAGQATDIDARYLTGEALFGELMAYESVYERKLNIGLLDEAQSNLQNARFQIEAGIFNVPVSNRLSAIEYLHSHMALGMLIATVAAERARITAISQSMASSGWSGTEDDYLLSLSESRRTELDTRISTQIRSTTRAALDGSNSIFTFYSSLASNGLLRREVDSWFSPLTHPTDCWNIAYDPSFDDPAYYQDLNNWDEPCCEAGWSEWPVHERCVGFADIFWYYYVKAPNWNCYRNSFALFDEEDAAACNRFFVRDTGRISASYDGYVANRASELGSVTDHTNDVYAAFVARVYGPIAIYLDSLWKALGKTGSRPRHALDQALDYTVTDVPGLPATDSAYGLPKSLNFRRFPGWSTAVTKAAIE